MESMAAADGRVLNPEFLDGAGLAMVARNLRDLVRLNRWFGGHRALRQVLGRYLHPLDRFSVLDVGSASGDMGRCIGETYRHASVLSLDHRLSHIGAAPSPRVVAEASALPFRSRSFDFVMCSSFLHHFDEPCAITLLTELRTFARRALIVLDLERHPLAHSFLPATRHLFRWSELTVHDGCASVAAGFTTAELARIARQAGAENAEIRSHRPWFRISAVIPASPEGGSAIERRRGSPSHPAQELCDDPGRTSC
jgi:2-polyprenyl-3-methyl-5-hydroxy-6-metoxy-1,4-benzoquinol methylase